MGRSQRLICLGLLLGLLSVVGAGCGSSDSSSQSTGSTSGSEDNATAFVEMEETVESAFEGKYTELPESGPKAVPGKNVWLVDCSLNLESCARVAKGFEESTAAIGWKATVVDGKLEPALTSQLIQRAVAAKADAIVGGAVDCPSNKTALAEAKAAGIPTFSIATEDCDPPLYHAEASFGGEPWVKGNADLQTPARVEWAIAKTKGKLKVIDVELTDAASTRGKDVVFRETLEDKCPECEIVESIELTSATVGNAQSLMASALTKHPDANSVFPFASAAYPAGIRAALEQAGRKDSMTLIGDSCDGEEIAMMHEGWEIDCYGYNVEQGMWQLTDWMNRTFSGEPVGELPKLGVALKMIDKDHNLPAGDKFPSVVDFRSAYEKIWGVG